MRNTDHTPSSSVRSTDRIFNEDDRWFVRTREGRRGPFGSRRAAEAEAELFVDTVKFLQQNHPAMRRDVDPDDVTVVDLGKPPCH